MKAVVMHMALTRDWNEAFQPAMSELRKKNLSRTASFVEEAGNHQTTNPPPQHLVHQQDDSSPSEGPVHVEIKVTEMTREFTQVAETVAQVIVDELDLPDEVKLVPPAKLGGIAGGEKYISHSILFKFAIDSKNIYGGDEWAMKVAQHEIKGLAAYINYSLNARFPVTLHFPIMTTIDYKGYRLNATSILPVGPDTLIYGSADGGKTVHNKFKEMSALMRKAGRQLNLKTHWAFPLTGKPSGVQICGPVDIEGHLGTDKRLYVLDTARVFPPTTPDVKLPGSFLSQLMRPEYVKNYAIPLCSDAFCQAAQDPDDPSVLEEHNKEVRQATQLLIERVVPQFARRFENFFKKIFHKQKENDSDTWHTIPEYSRYLVIQMHRAGINVRYMGYLRKHTTNTLLNRWLLMEMTSRVLKNHLRELLREAANEQEMRSVIAEFFYNLLHGQSFWQDHDPKQFSPMRELEKRFCGCFYSSEKEADWRLLDNLHLGAVLRRMCFLLGLRFTKQLEDTLWSWVEGGSVGEAASVETFHAELIGLEPKVAQLPLVSHLRAKSLEKSAHNPTASARHQQLKLLHQAKEEYIIGLEMKSDDLDLLLGLGKVLSDIAKILKEQSRSKTKRSLSTEIERTRALAQRHIKEALQVDSTKADTLAAYAIILADHFPEKREKAGQYFQMALQASPYNSNLIQRYQVFKQAEENDKEEINPVLEKKRSIIADSASALTRRLSRSVYHSYEEIPISAPSVHAPRRFHVHILSARDLHAMDSNGKADPYCVVTLGNQKHTTEIKKKDLNPEWNETFEFLVGSEDKTFKVEVWDWNRLSHNELIGQCVIALVHSPNKPQEDWHRLRSTEQTKPVHYLGEIKVGIKGPFL